MNKCCYSFILLLSFSLVMCVYAQETSPLCQKTDSLITRDGEQVWVHKVMAGQTLFSIAKTYGVKVGDVKLINDDLSNTINPGQVIYIPLPEVKPKPNKDPRYKEHVVRQGETLYSIGRDYDLHVEEVRHANPGIGEVLSVGQSLLIPKKSKNTDYKEYANHPLSSFGADSLKQDGMANVSSAATPTDSILHVGILFPLYLNEADSIRVDDTYDLEGVTGFKSFQFLQFIEGALLAIDSLEKQELRVELYIYDVTEDSTTVTNLFRRGLVQHLDLVFGPVYPAMVSLFNSQMEQLRKEDTTGRHSGKYVIPPFAYKEDIVRGRPYVVKMLPSMQAQLSEIADYLLANFLDSNVVIVFQNEQTEVELFRQLSAMLIARSDSATYRSVFKPFKYDMESSSIKDRLANMFDKQRGNVVLSLSGKQAFVSEMLRMLNKFSRERSLTVFGLSTWVHFTNIDMEYIHNLNLHLFTPVFTDYCNAQTSRFVNAFRTVYLTEPDKYAFRGFDMVYFMVRHCFGRETLFSTSESGLCSPRAMGLNLGMQFQRASVADGWENAHLHVIRYDNYRLFSVKP